MKWDTAALDGKCYYCGKRFPAGAVVFIRHERLFKRFGPCCVRLANKAAEGAGLPNKNNVDVLQRTRRQ